MADEYFYQEYPKMMYNKAGEYTVVDSKEDEDSLEGEWFASLLEMGVETCPAARRSVPLSTIVPGFTPPVPPVEEESSRGRD